MAYDILGVGVLAAINEWFNCTLRQVYVWAVAGNLGAQLFIVSLVGIMGLGAYNYMKYGKVVA